MEFVPFVILAVMVKKIIDYIRELTPTHWRAKTMLPFSWTVGVVITLLFSLSPELSSAIVIWSEHTLANASVALVIVYGFAVGTGAGVVHDALKPTTPPHDVSKT